MLSVKNIVVRLVTCWVNVVKKEFVCVRKDNWMSDMNMLLMKRKYF